MTACGTWVNYSSTLPVSTRYGCTDHAAKATDLIQDAPAGTVVGGSEPLASIGGPTKTGAPDKQGTTMAAGSRAAISYQSPEGMIDGRGFLRAAIYDC